MYCYHANACCQELMQPGQIQLVHVRAGSAMVIRGLDYSRLMMGDKVFAPSIHFWCRMSQRLTSYDITEY